MSNMTRRRRQPSDDQLQIDFVPGGLRRDKMHKFDLEVDGYVHGIGLDGASAEGGDSGTVGYYWSVALGPKALRQIHDEAAAQGDRLTTEEENLIADSAGAIVREDSRGFVSVTYYDDQRDLDKAWEEVEEEIYGSDEEDEEDEDDDGD